MLEQLSAAGFMSLKFLQVKKPIFFKQQSIVIDVIQHKNTVSMIFYTSIIVF
ncbi:unnamed protein product [Paramecium sonneborni]|uniref:Uncharacterized protein n=1 Tax=Paramecium sonneborni TaxID=65129 RepID=A0A8S1NNQ6_9CILI|nr:unnamed protein product [Paramecium sonneborni]